LQLKPVLIKGHYMEHPVIQNLLPSLDIQIFQNKSKTSISVVAPFTLAVVFHFVYFLPKSLTI